MYDYKNRPIWVTPDKRIYLESFNPLYRQAHEFLTGVTENVCRSDHIHEFKFTIYSLYTAISIGFETHTIIKMLKQLSKTQIDLRLEKFVKKCTRNYGKIKLVLKSRTFWMESERKKKLEWLICDEVIRKSINGNIQCVKVLRRHIKDIYNLNMHKLSDYLKQSSHQSCSFFQHIINRHLNFLNRPLLSNNKSAHNESLLGFMNNQIKNASKSSQFTTLKTAIEPTVKNYVIDGLKNSSIWYIEILASRIEFVKERCLPRGLNYPLMEEYDFSDDKTDRLEIEIRTEVKVRPYQKNAVRKMFTHGRARSGIIVLPCGAGKSLTGILAATRINKSVLVLCINSISVDQWKRQFEQWSTIAHDRIHRFTFERKEYLNNEANVTITTYTMIAFNQNRATTSQKIIEKIKSREWGLLILDEVHVVPAHIFRNVTSIIKAHCRLGLTATLVREDERIKDLIFLIGPKLYEANWLDLTKNRYIASVMCNEVICPMTKEFNILYREQVEKQDNNTLSRLLYIMNPNKIRACQKLILWHEKKRTQNHSLL
jgi:DNA excision repair protein ERCC-3